MRRRDLLTIAATQQVREMQEGAAINYNPRSAFACDRTPEPTLGKTIQLCFYLKKETSESSVPRNIFNNSAGGYSASTDRNICVCYYPKEDKLVVSSYTELELYVLKSPQTGIYNLCVTIDHEGLSKVYRDGALVSELKQRATTSTNPLFIGLGAANMATPPNLAISNSYVFAGNVILLRIFNYALSASQIAALYNNGKPEEYVLPTADKVGCIAEYLPQNLTTAHDGDMTDKTAIAWLDSAKQIPLNDEYLPPLLQSVGGYDLTALGTPEIVEKARVALYWKIMTPMTLDGWIGFNYKPLKAIIEDGAIKVPFPTESGLAYANGVFMLLPFEIPVGYQVSLIFKAKADVAGSNIVPFIGRSGSGLYAQSGAVLTTDWQTYEAPAKKDTSMNPYPLTSVGIYPAHNLAAVGNYYFKDIEILAYNK